MQSFLTKAVAIITAIFTMLNLIFCPADDFAGVYDPVTEKEEKPVYDEGEFSMNEYDLIVSPDGNDENAGTVNEPLKTLAEAKNRLKNINYDKDITVWFRGGEYQFDKSVVFNAEDKSNVTYRSYPNEEVIFSGGRAIDKWEDTTINGVSALAADVDVEKDGYFKSLFKGEKRLPLSQWPKEDAFKIKAVDEKDIINTVDVWNNFVAFYADKTEVMNFENLSDVRVKVQHYWYDEMLPIANIDTDSGRIELTKPSSLNLREDDNFVFENVREKLSLPGEWYLDRAEEKLYYIPEVGDTAENTVLYTGATEKLIELSGVNDISFQGIKFTKTDWSVADGTWIGTPGAFVPEENESFDNIKYTPNFPQAAYDQPAAIEVRNAKNINFVNCTFTNLSNAGLMLGSNVTDSSVETCKFENIGANAVYIKGDYSIPATTKNIRVYDCNISKYGRIFNGAIGVIVVHASDCEIEHNEIHDGWYTGISVGWMWGYAENPTNAIKVRNNLIYNIGNGWLSDMGGIYTLGIQPDTVLSGNVIYNVGCYGGNYGYGGWGIYLDEGSSGILVENNLAYDCSSQCFHQHYGKDNMIRNNIFAFGGEGIMRISRREEHNSLYFQNNILYGENVPMYFNTTKEGWFVDDGNIYWDTKHKGNVYSDTSTKIGERYNIVTMVSRGYYNNATFADPGFMDADNRNFIIAKNSPVRETGFKPFEIDAGTKTLFS
ncbi:MAG: right-handed parallel beta-helix repeat-containing protein [Clostridia bacterium]|nr:right-handed parallel beta-helix repeat-containing protein [Clostridia bacterium]